MFGHVLRFPSDWQVIRTTSNLAGTTINKPSICKTGSFSHFSARSKFMASEKLNLNKCSTEAEGNALALGWLEVFWLHLGRWNGLFLLFHFQTRSTRRKFQCLSKSQRFLARPFPQSIQRCLTKREKNLRTLQIDWISWTSHRLGTLCFWLCITTVRSAYRSLVRQKRWDEYHPSETKSPTKRHGSFTLEWNTNCLWNTNLLQWHTFWDKNVLKWRQMPLVQRGTSHNHGTLK